MNELNLAMVMSLKDKLVGPLGRAVDQVERSLKGLDSQASKTARSSTAMADSLTKVGATAGSTRQVATEMRRLGDEAARTHREMGKLESITSRLRGLATGVAKGVAGAMAFSHVVADPLRQAADYDTELRRLANTAYAGRSLADRRAGMSSLNAGITAAVRLGGGSRDAALSALNALNGSGAFGGPDDALKLLPTLMSGVTASGASATELAKIAISAKQILGIDTPEGMAEVFDRAMAAGKAGGFELKDMAKWLPSQMAFAKSLALKGQGGLTELLAANQAAVITAGSPDEAGNNLVNLLGKINSQDTIDNFRDQGVDLTGSLAYANSKGVSSLQAFVSLVDRIVSADPRFRKAQAAAEAARGTATFDALNSQVDLFRSAAVGKVVKDRQALMPLLALMGNRSYMDEVRAKINVGKGSIASDAALIKEGAGYVFDQRAFEQQKAQTDAMSGANDAVSKLAQAQIDLYQRYPGFATALEGTKVAVMGLGAAAAGAGVVNLLSAGGGAAAAGSFASGSVKTAVTAATGVASLGAMAVLAAPALASSNPNREFVESVADTGMVGSADFASNMADQIAAKVSEKPIQVNVQIDGRTVESVVTNRQDAKARRQ